MCLLTSVTPTEALTTEHCPAHTPLVQRVCGDSQENPLVCLLVHRSRVKHTDLAMPSFAVRFEVMHTEKKNSAIRILIRS